MTTSDPKLKRIKFPGQWGNYKCLPTKEEQLEDFAKFIYEDVLVYWRQWKLPIPWSETKHSMRRMRCPLATAQEVRDYVTQLYLVEIRDLNNHTVYIPRGQVQTNEELSELAWKYSTQRDLLKLQKTKGKA